MSGDASLESIEFDEAEDRARCIDEWLPVGKHIKNYIDIQQYLTGDSYLFERCSWYCSIRVSRGSTPRRESTTGDVASVCGSSKEPRNRLTSSEILVS